ncbi:helix-turn-helix domain-containing protein [Solirubrobacter phytolaccae]|uniref:Helix-turn-helix domain-containing protein n=1 Tax=Solirubrobacter phytolaccae TaxID=1404360 RepID=A0A9X3S6E4_9ACTN|nr:helix-turn-helix domain-containing protein [Solirubrobacter phytolaccae]MDA0179809.1 helix-turn-helix domain-containing protein [Solirubrobacter phytolaccae]
MGRLLDRERWELARHAIRVRVAALPLGAWDIRALDEVSPANVGLLVIDGVIARELTFEGVVSTELFGPGDLVRPWALDDSTRLLESATCWNTLASLRVAVIDQAVAARLSSFPELNAVLVDRLNERARRLAMMQAIAHLNRVDARVEAVLWLLAERWGRVTSAGIVVDLTLSHRALGQLIGARRPTVSTALASLARTGRVSRRPDGAWLLDPGSRPTAGLATDGAIRQRRRLFPAPEPELAFADEPPVPMDDVWSAIEALYEKSRVQGEDVEALRGEIAALRQRARLAASHETRRRGAGSRVAH